MALFDIVAVEWFLDRHLRVCLESPVAMEERLIHDGYPEHLVEYARAIMKEMANKAKNGEVWHPAKIDQQIEDIPVNDEGKEEWKREY